MAIKLDKIHYNYRPIDGFQKPFNFVMSPREPGKTAMMWFTKIYQPWKKNKKPWIYMVRNVIEITEALITSIQDTILNKFSDDNVKLNYKTSSFKDGIVDVYIGKELFFRIVALNIKLRKIKLAVLKNIGAVFADEWIIDPRSEEKYLNNEAFKIKEAYSTWRRECNGQLKMYFAGNPYSLFNPLFVSWGVDTNKLKKGEFYVGENFVIHWATLHPKLREKLLRDNPLYEFDEDYSNYAVEGSAINDVDIRVRVQRPQNYSLQFVFRFNGKYIAIFKNNFYDLDDKFFCEFMSPNDIGKRRDIYCFDFEDLVNRTALVSREDMLKFNRFKTAVRRRGVEFQSVDVYYFIKEIYFNL